MKHLPYDLSPEELQAFTPDWQGERDAQGRPMVPDQILDEIERFVSIPHAWGILKAAGYVRQTLWGYDSTRPNEVMVGRAATASYLPHRPDLRACLMTLGHGAGEIGDMVSCRLSGSKKGTFTWRTFSARLRMGRLSANGWAALSMRAQAAAAFIAPLCGISTEF